MLTQNLLTPAASTALPTASLKTAPSLINRADSATTKTQRQTDVALESLHKTAATAAVLADQEHTDSSWFGLAGVIRHGLHFILVVGLVLICLAAVVLVLSVVATFYPPLTPLILSIEPLIVTWFSGVISRLFALYHSLVTVVSNAISFVVTKPVQPATK